MEDDERASSSASEDENIPEQTDEQTAQVVHLHDLTGLELTECRTTLERCNWDIERAVHEVFNVRDGVRQNVYQEDAHPPVPPMRDPVAVPVVVFHQQNNVGLRHRNIPSANVPPPLPQLVYDRHTLNFTADEEENDISWFSWGARLLTIPFRLLYSTIYDVIHFILTLLVPDQRLAVTDPLGDVVNFINSYQEKFGRTHPDFYQGAYSEALRLAKQDLRFFVVYLQDDTNRDNIEFCQRTLNSQAVIEYLNTNTLLWGCNINSGEGYRVSRSFRSRRFPFFAVIILKESRMTVVGRLEGKYGTDEFLQSLIRIIEQNQGLLNTERLRRDELIFSRNIRDDQDAAYLESERQDAEKERKRQEELERQREEENQEKIKLEEEARLREKWSSEIPEEPASDDPSSVRILIKFPNSTRIERRFLKSHSIKYIHYLVFCHPEAPKDFAIATNFPRKTLNCQPADDFEPPTLQEAGMTRAESLFVTDLEA